MKMRPINRNKKILLTATLLATLVGSVFPAYANDKEEIERLRTLIQELDQRVRVLDRKQEIAAEEAAAKQKATPVVTASDKGFGIKSSDGQFEYKLRGLVHLDYRSFGGDAYPSALNGFLARRIRPTFEGTVFGKYGFRFTPEFGESGDGSATSGSSQNKARILDAFLDARLDPAFQIRFGKHKPVVGLERLQSGSDTKFIERSYISNNILPNRDLGVTISGDVLGKKLNYAVGLFNGVTDGGESTTAQDTNTGKDFTARLFATPFVGTDSNLAGLGFGVAVTNGNTRGNTLASYKTPGQANSFFAYATGTQSNGNRNRVSPQAYFYSGPFGLLTEYAVVNQEVTSTLGKNKLKNDAWHVSASWLLTGEDASYKGVKPYSPFKSGSDGGWGAFELVARYQEANIDPNAVTFKSSTAFALNAASWLVGLNWYLNEDAKFAVNYERTDFSNGTGSTLNGKQEDFLVARYQLAF
jgi:phosphate-selective porin OprO/OprP